MTESNETLTRNEKIYFIIETIWVVKGVKHDISAFTLLNDVEIDRWYQHLVTNQ